MTDKIERKARRVERVRNRIMDAATEIITEKDFRTATTKEIAQRADMAEGTLYNYFKNKDDILMSIAERYVHKKRDWNASTDVENMSEFLESLFTPKDPTGALETSKDREVLKALLPEFLTNRELGQLYYERIVRVYLETLESKFEDLQSKGILENYDPKALSRLVYSSFIGFAVLDIQKDPEISNATEDFRKAMSKTYLDVLGKGMDKT